MKHIRGKVPKGRSEKQYIFRDSRDNETKAYRSICGVYVPTNLLNQHHPYDGIERLRTLGVLTHPPVYPQFCPACLWEYWNTLSDETASP